MSCTQFALHYFIMNNFPVNNFLGHYFPGHIFLKQNFFVHNYRAQKERQKFLWTEFSQCKISGTEISLNEFSLYKNVPWHNSPGHIFPVQNVLCTKLSWTEIAMYRIFPEQILLDIMFWLESSRRNFLYGIVMRPFYWYNSANKERKNNWRPSPFPMP